MSWLSILGGESVLFSAGWITQQPQKMKLFSAVPLPAAAWFDAQPTVVTLTQYDVLREVAVAPDKAKFATYGHLAMPPAFAVASLWLEKDGYRPQLDDLYIEQEELAEIRLAFDRLKLPAPGWL